MKPCSFRYYYWTVRQIGNLAPPMQRVVGQGVRLIDVGPPSSSETTAKLLSVGFDGVLVRLGTLTELPRAPHGGSGCLVHVATEDEVDQAFHSLGATAVLVTLSPSEIYCTHKLRKPQQSVNSQGLRTLRHATEYKLVTVVRLVSIMSCHYSGFVTATKVSDLMVDCLHEADGMGQLHFLLSDTVGHANDVQQVPILLKTIAATGIPLQNVTCDFSDAENFGTRLVTAALACECRSFACSTLGSTSTGTIAGHDLVHFLEACGMTMTADREKLYNLVRGYHVE